jgi:formate dehydrogenase maturation protein FdhE
VRCPFCGENELRSVALPTAEENARYLVYACGACKHYIKAIVAESPIADDLLPLEDLLTLPLDAAAQTEGYLK